MRLYKATLTDSYYIVDGDEVSVRSKGERVWRYSFWSAKQVLIRKDLFKLIGNNLSLK